MKSTIELDLQPFRTPNYVLTDQAPLATVPPAPLLRDEYRTESPKYKLSELSAETLDELCKQFRTDIFKKAGKEQPVVNRHEQS